MSTYVKLVIVELNVCYSYLTLNQVELRRHLLGEKGRQLDVSLRTILFALLAVRVPSQNFLGVKELLKLPIPLFNSPLLLSTSFFFVSDVSLVLLVVFSPFK